MSFSVEVFPSKEYARRAAARISTALPERGAVIITGGTTAARIYPELASQDAAWSGVEVFFSDERCVPPGHAESNFGMADEALLRHVAPARTHRIRGEEEPEIAADEYHLAISETARSGADLAMLGLGADAHICALFPGSTALDITSSLCVPVDRPDSMTGITLTPPAILPSREILLVATGDKKAEAVRRAVQGDEPPSSCPARVLARHQNATFLLDEAAASLVV